MPSSRCLGGCGRKVKAGSSRCPACLAEQKAKYRGPAWAVVRAAVLKRDDYACQIQGRHCTVVATEADHIDAAGPSEMWNLQAACKPCNSGKRDR